MNGGYAFTDPEQALLMFEVQDLHDKLRDFISAYAEEQTKDKPMSPERYQRTLEVIMNALLSAIGSHMVAMATQGGGP